MVSEMPRDPALSAGEFADPLAGNVAYEALDCREHCVVCERSAY